MKITRFATCIFRIAYCVVPELVEGWRFAFCVLRCSWACRRMAFGGISPFLAWHTSHTGAPKTSPPTFSCTPLWLAQNNENIKEKSKEARRVGLLSIHIQHPPVELKTISIIQNARLAPNEKQWTICHLTQKSGIARRIYLVNRWTTASQIEHGFSWSTDMPPLD